MEQITETTDSARTTLLYEFYASLSLLQSKAIKYVAEGENLDDKFLRIQDVIREVKATGAKIMDDEDILPRDCHCDPPCILDQSGMCKCGDIYTNC